MLVVIGSTSSLTATRTDRACRNGRRMAASALRNRTRPTTWSRRRRASPPATDAALEHQSALRRSRSTLSAQSSSDFCAASFCTILFSAVVLIVPLVATPALFTVTLRGNPQKLTAVTPGIGVEIGICRRHIDALPVQVRLGEAEVAIDERHGIPGGNHGDRSQLRVPGLQLVQRQSRDH
jgi:hypothetical protein